MFKVAIVGGSYCDNYKEYKDKCIYFLKNKAKEGLYIITTGDDFTARFASECRIDTETISTDFKKYGSKALLRRNEAILSKVDALIIFHPDNTDHKYLRQMAVDRNIPVRVVRTT